MKDTRREWDLNRPDAKQIDAPARVGDDDQRNGPSSLQKFDGEDLTVRLLNSLHLSLLSMFTFVVDGFEAQHLQHSTSNSLVCV